MKRRFTVISSGISAIIVCAHHVSAFCPSYYHHHQYHQPPTSNSVCTSSLLLYVQKPPSSSSSSLPPKPHKPKKKKKKNKYANFSQADNLTLDPLDALIQESRSKLEELHREEKKSDKSERRRKQSREKIAASLEAVDQLLPDDIIEGETAVLEEVEKRERDKRFFPDTKTIDPYDPTTYGYIELGTIIGAHGVHGFMKLTSITDFSEHRLCNPGTRHIKPPKRRSPREVQLVEGRSLQSSAGSATADSPGTYLIRLENVNDREEALQMRGHVLYALEEEKVDDLLDEDEYIVSDLIGLNVYLDENHEQHTGKGFEELFVGNIKGVVMGSEMCAIPGLGQDLLEVVLPSQKVDDQGQGEEFVLVPFVPEIVSRVDLDGRLISIIPPEGLLDLAYRREEKVRIKGLLPPISSYKRV